MFPPTLRQAIPRLPYPPHELAMTPLSKSLASYALCVFLAGSAGISAQTVGVSRKRVPEDSAETALQKTLAAAQTAMSKGDFNAAIQDYEDYLAKKPDNAGAHYNLGYAYSALKRPADAKTEYEKAISLDPTMGAAYLNLGVTLLKTDPGAAVAPLQKAVELDPDEARPKFLLGGALEFAGKLSQAVEQYQAAEKLDANNLDIQLSLGRVLLHSNRAADAEPAFRAAIAMRPDSPEAHLGLADSLIEQKKFDAASSELDAYLKTQPDDARARIEHASLLVRVGKEDDALAELDQAAKAGPEGIRALDLRSQIYFDKKQYDAAVPVLQKAAELAPQDPDIPARLGHVYLEKKDYLNAARELAAALKMNPSANDVLGDWITAEYLAKNYPAALQGLDLLSQRESLSAGTWFIRGNCYDKLGKVPEALDAYQKFLQLNKDENNNFYFEASARVRVLKRELENKR